MLDFGAKTIIQRQTYKVSVTIFQNQEFNSVYKKRAVNVLTPLNPNAP